MAERDRLREPRVGGPGHDALRVLARTRDEGADQGDELGVDAATGRQEPQAQVGHRQVVARAARVELGAQVSQAIRHGALHRRVHVFIGVVEGEPALRDLRADVRERLLEGTRLRRREQIGVLQRADVGHAGLDVLLREARVEGEGSPQGMRLGCGRRGEPPGPQLAAALVRRHRGPLPCFADHTFSGIPYRRT